MRRSSAALFVAVCTIASCGGRVLVYPGAGDGPASCTGAGARICGGSCGSVPDCPGGCAPLQTGDGSSSTYGVCFSDLPDRGQTPCAVCGSGQGCVERSPDVFVCVPLDLCADLRKLGAGDICWYGDKSPFDGGPVVAPDTCPDSDPVLQEYHAMCGGACGPCDTGLRSLDRCIGQGPNHPVGICTFFNGNPEDPASYPRCTVRDGSVTVPCPTGIDYDCAVYPSPPADSAVASKNGLCIPATTCTALHAALPGGLDCY